jgi:hypothetical protein
MSTRSEIEFTILPDGNVEFTIKGMKGRQCVPVADLFKVLGEVKTEQATSDYYAQDDEEQATINIQQ